MSTTVKRQSICLTLETKRQLDDLCNEYGENPSRIMMRAVAILHASLRDYKIYSDDKYKGE